MFKNWSDKTRRSNFRKIKKMHERCKFFRETGHESGDNPATTDGAKRTLGTLFALVEIKIFTRDALAAALDAP